MVKARQGFELKKTGEAKFISRKNNKADKAGADQPQRFSSFCLKSALILKVWVGLDKQVASAVGQQKGDRGWGHSCIE